MDGLRRPYRKCQEWQVHDTQVRFGQGSTRAFRTHFHSTKSGTGKVGPRLRGLQRDCRRNRTDPRGARGASGGQSKPRRLPRCPCLDGFSRTSIFPQITWTPRAIAQDSASLWLEGDPELRREWRRALHPHRERDPKLNRFGVGSPASQFNVGLREAWISYAKNGWEAKLGQQIIPWGKSDIINPTDFLTAKNYTFFNPDQEVRRLGDEQLLAQLDSQ